MEGSGITPISFARKVKYLVVRGVHRLMSIYPYEGEGEGVDSELDAAVRTNEQGLIVAQSLVPEAGLGLFADRDYETGELVCTYLGSCLTLFQMLRTRDWTFMMDCGKDRGGRRVHLDARHHPRIKAAYINHHFDRDKVNVTCDEVPDERKCLILAARRIRRGEELYLDYGPKYWHVVVSPPAEAPARAPGLGGVAAARARS